MRSSFIRILHPAIVLIYLSMAGCKTERQPPLFQLLPPYETGVWFENTITENIDFNLFEYPLIYNGGGVAIGDINNNGYADIFLAGNMVSSRLYLNQGDMRFDDITESAGIKTDRWITGVSMVDINNSGYLDIYLSVASPESAPPEERANLLFINNGDNTFTETAEVYGIDDTGFTTHAVFLDYNKNGLLDLFLLNHSPGSFIRDSEVRSRPGSYREISPGHDRLYRNNGDGTFTDVSKEAGILQTIGYGLGVVVADFNRNGWPDIYVSNDITPNDVLYINNKDGTFTDKSAHYFKQTSFSGMGADAADFNNDGWPDILQADMMPESIADRKRMSGVMRYEHFTNLRTQGFHYYYTKNSLQLNSGVNKDGDLIFSDISRLDDVAYTDWSWGALFGDYNNSGLKDILITNGFPKAIYDYDYFRKLDSASRAGTDDEIRKERYRILQNLHEIKIPNYLFKNTNGLRFTDVSEEWGFTNPGYAYGVAHGDLNNNGRLDLVINNINAPASIYMNNGAELNGNNYLMVELHGDSLNRQGIGSEVILSAAGQKKYLYQTLWRGYQSTVDSRLHFGLGQSNRIDSLEVIWPDGRYQLITEPGINQTVKLDYRDSGEYNRRLPDRNILLDRFSEITDSNILSHTHEQTSFNDYSVQPLLPHQLSRLGPPIAVADITGNGLDDLFIGGSAGFPGKLFIQHDDGRFAESAHLQPWIADGAYEDTGALFFDANGNGRKDLYVASGGYHLSPASDLLIDRLYINHGDGRFLRDRQALPVIRTSTAAVTAGDFTGNGLSDLFVGGRMAPQNYPHPVRSYLLRNDGGRFTDITEETIPEIKDPGGMITDAVWIDYNGDGKQDLVTAGIWMPVQFYKNADGILRNVTEKMELPPMRGWWFSLATADLNRNGLPDLIAGNLGLNHTFKTSDENRFGVYAADFSANLTTDIVFAIERDGTEFPFFGLAKLGREIYHIGTRFDTFDSFAKIPLRQIFSSRDLSQSLHFQADTFASVWLRNNGDGTFTSIDLPDMAQLSPIKGIEIHDVNKNGNPDLIVAGNLYHSEPEVPRADAGNGLWLKGDGRGNFEAISPFQSGFLAPLDVKNIALINTTEGKAIIVINNNDKVQIFKIKDIH